MTETPGMALCRACEALHASCPAAVEPGTQPAMIVEVPGGEPEFFIVRYIGNGIPQPAWLVHRWGTEPDGLISVNRDGTVKAERGLTLAEAQRVASEGVPRPRDGALYGWAPLGTVTALMAFYGEDGDPEPAWTLSLHAEAAESDWPPFAAGRPFGTWFWDGIATGAIVDLSSVVAKTSHIVWWVIPEGTESGMVAVARDVTVPGGRVLPHGVFAWRGLFDGNTALPSLGDALAARRKTDLGPQCRRFSATAA